MTWDLGKCLLVDTGTRVFQRLPLAAQVHAGTEPGSGPPEPLSLVPNIIEFLEHEAPSNWWFV